MDERNMDNRPSTLGNRFSAVFRADVVVTRLLLRDGGMAEPWSPRNRENF